MNHIRMCILRQMWDEHKQVLIQNLQSQKATAKDKRLAKLIRLSDEIREVVLESYFHYCKEKAAKTFIDWRIQQAEFAKDPVMRKALRICRLSSYLIYNKEDEIFEIYRLNKNNFESVKTNLIAMELEIQR